MMRARGKCSICSKELFLNSKVVLIGNIVSWKMSNLHTSQSGNYLLIFLITQDDEEFFSPRMKDGADPGIIIITRDRPLK